MLYVSHFPVFSSVAWADIPNKKRKSLQPKSEKCFFFCYYKYVKGYKLLQHHSNEIIIRIYVKFVENVFACEPNLMFVSSADCNPSLVLVPYLFLFLFLLLQMMTTRMKIHLYLLTFLQMSPLNMNLHQYRHFPNGYIQLEK
jgi:hypothetical protein